MLGLWRVHLGNTPAPKTLALQIPMRRFLLNLIWLGLLLVGAVVALAADEETLI